jgi:poly(3-hydroxybutyrate) depolymerase
MGASFMNCLARLLAFTAVLGAWATSAAPVSAAESLRGYNIDKAAMSVSGISSGGYMAQQFHVAHSREIMGAGAIAAGPWDCADSKPGWLPVFTATGVCSHMAGSFVPFMGPPNAQASIAATKAAARSHTIDPIQGMAGDKVFLFSGSKDTLVPSSVVDSLRQYYLAFLPQNRVRYVNTVPAEHAMITDGYGNSCDKLGSPYINNCGYDGAGEILRYIYGDLKPPVDPASGTLAEFSQSEFLPSAPISMAPVGHLFVPGECQAGQSCRLHIAFHGCLQDEQHIGDAYYKFAGYNRWAAANRIIVSYPQIVASEFKPQNPNACWDWWGYTDAKFATKNGKQIIAVQKMIDRLTSGLAR